MAGQSWWNAALVCLPALLSQPDIMMCITGDVRYIWGRQ